MTRLRWTNPPRETDPAHAQRDLHVLAPDKPRSRRRSPRDDLFNRCLKAKLKHERACKERDAIRRQLKSYVTSEAKSENTDRRRMARGLKPESLAAKAKRAVQIEKAKQRLTKAEAAVTSAHEEHLRMMRLWEEGQPT